jgi:hypothetical protein
MGLTAAQRVTAYDSVKDTFSRNGIPTDEQSKAYISSATGSIAPPSTPNARFPTRLELSSALPRLQS